MPDVHYDPPWEGKKKVMEGLGTVIIGSYSSRPAQGTLVPRHEVSPPSACTYRSRMISVDGYAKPTLPTRSRSTTPAAEGCRENPSISIGRRIAISYHS